MANTYTLINSTSLSSSAASVTFSAIPATYDDLVLVSSIRTANAGDFDDLYLTFNGSATGYSRTKLWGDGSSAQSSQTSNAIRIVNQNSINGNTSTSNTFSTLELYIPSYRVSQNKPSSIFFAMERNLSAAQQGVLANLWSNTAAITSIKLEANASFVSGSTFWLYGIKNS